MPTVHTAYGELYYAVSRSRAERRLPSLLLLHGAGGSHLLWPGAVRRLPLTTVYALDLPGHGRSGGVAEPHVDHYAQAVARFMAGIGIEQAIIVGHSMGGAVALRLAIDFPEQVAGLVLISTGARLRVARATFDALDTDLDTAVELFSRSAWGPAAKPEDISAGKIALRDAGTQTLLADFTAADHFDVMVRLGAIQQPTLIMVGASDQLTPPKYARYLAAHIASSHLITVEGAGHMLMLERPAETAAGIREFLQRIDADRPASS
ncbi:MAG: alpha/beta hydrolase [Anaerolineales bacterium]|nr:alpha/beta hydrolase [Anaerolineales bacterium]